MTQQNTIQTTTTQAPQRSSRLGKTIRNKTLAQQTRPSSTLDILASTIYTINNKVLKYDILLVGTFLLRIFVEIAVLQIDQGLSRLWLIIDKGYCRTANK